MMITIFSEVRWDHSNQDPINNYSPVKSIKKSENPNLILDILLAI